MSDPTYDQTFTRISTFTRLAKRGRHPGASAGEHVAHRLAVALHLIGDDMALLDPDAIHGFSELCQLAHGPWHLESDKQLIFSSIESAAK